MIVHKSKLAGMAALKGCTNKKTYIGHSPGTARFVGFVGRHVGGQKYEGECQFTALASPSDGRADFSIFEQGDKHGVQPNDTD